MRFTFTQNVTGNVNQQSQPLNLCYSNQLPISWSNILVQYQPETISNTICLFINIYLKQCTLQAIYTLADPSSLEICCQIVRKMPVLKYISHIFNFGNVNHSVASFSSICLRASSRAQVPNLKKKQLTLAFPLVFSGKLQGIFHQIIP